MSHIKSFYLLFLLQELRQECYLLSSVCKGGPPGPVAPGEWNLIPPKFEPYVSDTKADATSLNGQLGLEIGHEAKEVIMSDQVSATITIIVYRHRPLLLCSRT